MRRSSHNRALFFLFAIGVTVGTTATFILLLFSWAYARAFTRLPCAGAYESLESLGVESEPVVFRNPEGILLRGWFAQGEKFPEAGIVVLPGAAGNTEHALPDARILHEAGFSTLVFEHRACADSASLHSGGYLEGEDLALAAEFLQTRPGIERVGVLGFSTGGSAAILAASLTQDIEAVVAMGGFSSLANDVLEPEIEHGWTDRASRALILLFIGYQLGIDPDRVSPIDQVERISPRPVLLIYGDQERLPGEALFEAAGDPKELWVVPAAGHGGYTAADPQGYQSRIVTFFRSAFDLQ
jgi:dienelactone hydrolase